mmetsp:Transcript_57652/g.172011  ORF Transcript_57652/g.172011 Transcript_57652/m.172011 type:complete len:334 (-) Transcript_57652:1038-2039(-)
MLISVDFLLIWLCTSSNSSLRAEASPFMLSQSSSRSRRRPRFSSRFFSSCERSSSAAILSARSRSSTQSPNPLPSCSRRSSSSTSSSPLQTFASAAARSSDSSLPSLSAARAFHSCTSLSCRSSLELASDNESPCCFSLMRRTCSTSASDCSMLPFSDDCRVSILASLSTRRASLSATSLLSRSISSRLVACCLSLSRDVCMSIVGELRVRDLAIWIASSSWVSWSARSDSLSSRSLASLASTLRDSLYSLLLERVLFNDSISRSFIIIRECSPAVADCDSATEASFFWAFFAASSRCFRSDSFSFWNRIVSSSSLLEAFSACPLRRDASCSD